MNRKPNLPSQLSNYVEQAYARRAKKRADRSAPLNATVEALILSGENDAAQTAIRWAKSCAAVVEGEALTTAEKANVKKFSDGILQEAQKIVAIGEADGLKADLTAFNLEDRVMYLVKVVGQARQFVNSGQVDALERWLTKDERFLNWASTSVVIEVLLDGLEGKPSGVTAKAMALDLGVDPFTNWEADK